MTMGKAASKAGEIIAKGILGLIVLGCIGISTLFAFEFGFAKGATPIFQWPYGIASGGLELFKAALPLLAAGAWMARQWIKGVFCSAAFLFLTGMSLWCAWGTTASQLNERMGLKAAIVSEQDQKTATLNRLRADKKALPTYVPTTQSTVDTARQAVASAEDQRVEECGAGRGGRGRRCREREGDVRNARELLLKAETNKAVTDQAQALDARIRLSETALAAVDVKTVAKAVDPQAASIAQVMDIDEAKASLIGHWIFAIGIEIGSGLGLWLVFGHGGARQRENDKPVEVVKEEPLPIQEPAPSTGVDVREAFFKECVYPMSGNRVKAADVYAAYVRWCYVNEHAPMSEQAFGRGSKLAKKKTGGSIWYLECALAPVGKMVPELRLVSPDTNWPPPVTPRLGRMAKIAQSGTA